MTVHCHKMIRSVAQEAAGQLYETLMSDDVLFAEWKRQNPGLTSKQLETRFISKRWPLCVEFARATLATMLSRPIDERAKEAIMEALVLDSQLVRGRHQNARQIGATDV